MAEAGARRFVSLFTFFLCVFAALRENHERYAEQIATGLHRKGQKGARKAAKTQREGKKKTLKVAKDAAAGQLGLLE